MSLDAIECRDDLVGVTLSMIVVVEVTGEEAALFGVLLDLDERDESSSKVIDALFANGVTQLVIQPTDRLGRDDRSFDAQPGEDEVAVALFEVASSDEVRDRLVALQGRGALANEVWQGNLVEVKPPQDEGAVSGERREAGVGD
jgi:hypothetical protein